MRMGKLVVAALAGLLLALAVAALVGALLSDAPGAFSEHPQALPWLR